MDLEAWLAHLDRKLDPLIVELEEWDQKRRELAAVQEAWRARLPTLSHDSPLTVAEIQGYLCYPDKIAREISRLQEQESENQTRIDRCRSNIVEIRRKMQVIEAVLARRQEVVRQVQQRREERTLTEMVGASTRWRT